MAPLYELSRSAKRVEEIGIRQILKLPYMNWFQRSLLVLSFCWSVAGHAQTGPPKGIAGSNAKMNAFITALMHKMTLNEKIGQLNITPDLLQSLLPKQATETPTSGKSHAGR